MVNPDEVTDPWIELTIVPRALAPKIGRISVQHTHLDLELNRAIWQLLGSRTNKAQAVTQNIRNMTDRLDLFWNLILLSKRKSQEARFKELKDHIFFANSDRNHLIHDQFYSGNVQTMEFSILKRDPLNKKHKMYQFTKDVLDDLELRLIRIRMLLSMAMTKNPRWLTEPFPSLDKSPTQLLRLRNEQQQRDSKPPLLQKALKKKHPKK